MSDLNKNNFFTEKTFYAEPFYQYHPLFRDFLLSRAKALLAPEEITNIRLNAAALLEESGQIEDAANLLLEASNWEGIIRLIMNNALTLLSTSRIKTLEEWLKKIPEEICGKIPWLLYWNGICKMSINPAESRSYFERAFQLFNEQVDSAGILLSWSGAVDAILNEWNDFTLLDPWIEWLDNYIKNNVPFPSPEIEAQVATSMSGALSWRQPQRKDIKGWMEQALLLCQRSPDMNVRLKIYGHAIHYYNWMGEMTKCGIIAGDLKRMSESRNTSPLILLVSKYSEAMMYCGSAMTYKKSLQAVSEGLEIAQKSGVHICDPVLFAQGVYSSFNLGDMAIAGEFLQKMEANSHK